jgi:hypothetical protein
MFNNINIQSTVRILNTSIKNGYGKAMCVTRAEIFAYITYAKTVSI